MNKLLAIQDLLQISILGFWFAIPARVSESSFPAMPTCDMCPTKRCYPNIYSMLAQGAVRRREPGRPSAGRVRATNLLMSNQ